MPVCVINISLRWSSASATTPLIMEKRMIGTIRTTPTIPSAMAFWSSGTSKDTCQRMAAFCIMEPEKEMSWPVHSRRKLRCWRAMKGEDIEEWEIG